MRTTEERIEKKIKDWAGVEENYLSLMSGEARDMYKILKEMHDCLQDIRDILRREEMRKEMKGVIK